MDLSNFSILKEDDNNYHIGHPNGRSLIVNKKGMSDKAHEAIKKYAHGGEVKMYAEPQDAPIGQDSAPTMDEVNAAAQNISPEMQNALRHPQSQYSPTSSPQYTSYSPDQAIQNTQQAISKQDPFVQNKLSQESLLGEEQKHLQETQKQLKGAQGQENAAIADYNDQAAGMDTPEDIVNSYKAKDDDLMKQMMDSKIDPQRYYKNMSTGNAIASAFGLLFGGFGAGLTGGPNQVMDHINKAVERDIEAQKMDQGKVANLWKMNREALGNDLQANIATHNQMITGVQAQAAMQGAKMQNIETQGKYQQLVDQLEQQKATNRYRMGLLSGGGPETGGRLPTDPSLLVNDLVPEPQRAKALDDIEKAKQANQIGGQLMDMFWQANKENTAARTGGGYLRTPQVVENMRNLAMPLMLDEAKRPNELLINQFNKYIPGPGDFDNKVAEKAQGMANFIKSIAKGQTFEAATGMPLDRFNSTALPKLEEHGQIQYKDGVPYRRQGNVMVRVK